MQKNQSGNRRKKENEETLFRQHCPIVRRILHFTDSDTKDLRGISNICYTSVYIQNGTRNTRAWPLGESVKLMRLLRCVHVVPPRLSPHDGRFTK